jgi:hypothetical protein
MEYVIPVVILVLLIAGFVTFMVLNATKKSGPVADRDDEGAPGMGADETPLGDTTQHAGEQTEGGATVGRPDGSGRPAEPADAARVAHPGEAEGEERLRFEPERPASERLADRDG